MLEGHTEKTNEALRLATEETRVKKSQIKPEELKELSERTLFDDGSK